MTNFIFKSPKRHVKNWSLTEGYLMVKLESIQKELRHQRCDLKDISLKLERLMIDKHLQMQVDEYFDEEARATAGQEDPDIKDDND